MRKGQKDSRSIEGEGSKIMIQDVPGRVMDIGVLGHACTCPWPVMYILFVTWNPEEKLSWGKEKTKPIQTGGKP